MKALDTKILARFYVDDPGDPEAARQRPLARHIMVEETGLFVPLTVVLELEWVLRAFYGFDTGAFSRVGQHLLGTSNVTVEAWSRVLDALDLHIRGLDFADALHLVASEHCEKMYSFDDRRFARRVARFGVTTPVVVPSAL